MCSNAIFSGQWKTHFNNPLQFLKYNLMSIRIVRNGTAIVDYDTTHSQQVCFKTSQSLHFEQDGLPNT